jgi:hypothetical protein
VTTIVHTFDTHADRGQRLRLVGLVLSGLLIAVVAFTAGALVMKPQSTLAGPVSVHSQPPPFHDVVGNRPLREAIAKVWQFGLMSGTAPDAFGQEATATRGAAAVVMVRCARGTDYEPDPILSPDRAHPYAHWAAPWLAAAGDLGLMDPSAVVAADLPMTRADLAALLATCMPLEGR